MMTPCDGTANSTRWCCGDNVECCSGDIGVETIAQTFTGMIASSTAALPSSGASASTSGAATNPSTSETAVLAHSTTSSALSGGAIAGIVIGALAGVALIGAALFFIARRHRPAAPPPAEYAEIDRTTHSPKISHAHEADVGEPQVSEVSAANTKDHAGRTRVYEVQ